MKTKNILYFIATLLLVTLPFSGFAQNDSIYIHSKGKIIYKESLEKIDSITFTRPDVPPVHPEKQFKALLLQVDYATGAFESGAELSFYSPLDTVFLKKELDPSNFCNLQFSYPEIDELLFKASSTPEETGKIEYPEKWIDKEDFLVVGTEEPVSPKNGFEDILGLYDCGDGYFQAWESLQYLVKVREFLRSNPEQTVKYFLYLPRPNLVQPIEGKWFFILYN